MLGATLVVVGHHGGIGHLYGEGIDVCQEGSWMDGSYTILTVTSPNPCEITGIQHTHTHTPPPLVVGGGGGGGGGWWGWGRLGQLGVQVGGQH